MTTRTRCLVMALLAFLGGGGWDVVASAGEYRITPALELRETYDDNIFFRNVGDWEHRISPQLNLDLLTETSQLGALVRVDISEYNRHSEFDTTDQLYEVRGNTLPGERYQLSFSGSYETDYTFVDALEESGILAERSRRKNYFLAPATVFSLGPRDTLRLSYTFRKINYTLDRYNDTAVNAVGLTWAHDMADERTTLFATVSGSQVVFEGEDERWFLADAGRAEQRTEDVTQETLRLWLGADHAWSEWLDASLQIGVHYTESEFPVLTDPLVRVVAPGLPPAYEMDNGYDSGFILDGALNWHWERLRLTVSLNRDVSESTFGENITRDRLRVSAGYRLTERWNARCSAAYYESETEGYSDPEERQTRNVNPSMTYRITENLDLQMGYRYTWTENEITDESEERNRVFAQLSAAWPLQY